MFDAGDLYFSYVKHSDMKGEGFLYKCNVFNPHLDLTTTGSYSTIHVQPGKAAVCSIPIVDVCMA